MRGFLDTVYIGTRGKTFFTRSLKDSVDWSPNSFLWCSLSFLLKTKLILYITSLVVQELSKFVRMYAIPWRIWDRSYSYYANRFRMWLISVCPSSFFVQGAVNDDTITASNSFSLFYLQKEHVPHYRTFFFSFIKWISPQNISLASYLSRICLKNKWSYR